MRKVGVVTVGRSDYGIYLPLLQRLRRDRGVQLQLIVGGMHLSRGHGLTIRQIEADGFAISARVLCSPSQDTPRGVGEAMGAGVAGFARVLARLRPDILVVLGDRFEMHAAALAALPAKIPVAHIHGGELTQGAMDDSLRHSITKLSHLHFVATPEYARRVIQMGEEPWRVKVVGALGLDNLRELKLMRGEELEREYGIRLDRPPLLVTFHPVTLEYEKTEWQVKELVAALHTAGQPVVFTSPNADTGNRAVRRQIQAYVRTHSNAWVVENFGAPGYFSMMAHAAAMVGNSSSGIIEAPSFRLPVVNIGTRQGGRVRAINVVDVDYRRTSIHEGICQVLDDRWRRRLRRMGNPYFRAGASVLIARILATCALDAGLIAKCFWALPGLRGNSPQRRELLQKVTKQTKGAAGGRRREAR